MRHVPVTDPITTALEGLLHECVGDAAARHARGLHPGARARRSRACSGSCWRAIEGDAYAAGDAAAPFTIQSISKPFVYALALEDARPRRGRRARRRRAERRAVQRDQPRARHRAPRQPDDQRRGDPRRPRCVDGGFERIAQRVCRRSPGARSTLDEAVYESERRTGDRNRAIAHLMRGAGSLTSAGRRRRSTPTSGSARCWSPRPTWR